jgi:hypothetical protein
LSETRTVNGKEIKVRGRIPNIPPNVDNWEIGGEMLVKEAITLYAFAPHMHLRGKDIRYTLIWPDGRQQVLLDVPRFDFNWQLHYELAEPLKIPLAANSFRWLTTTTRSRTATTPHLIKKSYGASRVGTRCSSPGSNTQWIAKP